MTVLLDHAWTVVCASMVSTALRVSAIVIFMVTRCEFGKWCMSVKSYVHIVWHNKNAVINIYTFLYQQQIKTLRLYLQLYYKAHYKQNAPEVKPSPTSTCSSISRTEHSIWYMVKQYGAKCYMSLTGKAHYLSLLYCRNDSTWADKMSA